MAVDLWHHYHAPSHMISAISQIEKQKKRYGDSSFDLSVEDRLNELAMDYCRYESSDRRAPFLWNFYLNWFIEPLSPNLKEFNKDFIVFAAKYRKEHPIEEGYFTALSGEQGNQSKEMAEILEKYEGLVKWCWQTIERDAQTFRAQGYSDVFRNSVSRSKIQ